MQWMSVYFELLICDKATWLVDW